MTHEASSTRGLARFRGGLLPFALVLGLGFITSHQSASAAIGLAQEAQGQPVVSFDARSNGAIVVAERDGRGGKQWGQGRNDWNKGNNHWNKDWGNNKNWNARGNKNWSKNYNNHRDKGWGNNNSNRNENWNNRAYVRDWGSRPHYGQFVGGVILGSILAANGVGVVPYAPEPYLCWYWADPYMYRGYWDYCE